VTLELVPPPDDSGPLPDDGPEGTTGKFTDLWAAEALYMQHGEDLRFVGGWKRWVAWDGRRWQLDTEALALHFAADTARVLCTMAMDHDKLVRKKMLTEGLTDALKDELENAAKEFKAAIALQHARKLAAMLTSATALRELVVHFDDFDADPWMFNCQNGVVRLTDGKLFPHLRTELQTMVCGVTYDAKAKCPTWDAFLERVQPDMMMRLYLQRLAGYSLTGSTREHCLAFHYGGGANGKSTFITVLHAILGDYASPAHPRLIFRSPNGDRHLTERATLFRKRFVSCPETSESTSFDEATVKDLTGGDIIAARRMREDEWKFFPTHKLHLAGNEKPIVRATDDGFWRRMHLVPWLVTIPEGERDHLLVDRLREELPGILRWAVDGCLEWLRIGLAPPDAVLAATNEYRRISDTGGLYLSTCERDEGFTMSKRDFREAYERWCDEQGYEPLGARRMAEVLRRHGITETKIREGLRTVHAWKGLRLVAT
jgi:putative DNA primase/helicase